MAKSPKDARNLAVKYRYAGDKPSRNFERPLQSAAHIQRELSASGLQVSRDLTPVLYESLVTACRNLQFPVENVHAYISSSPELQALCFGSDDDVCVISISSGLINLLNEDEITFVIGHEIGHHILRHHENARHKDSIESLMNQRAQEISVDRAGLIACQSLEASLKATMKVISGLPDQYIRFDTSNFINQLRTAGRQDATLADSLTTHPSLILRARALLWFSMNEELPLGDKDGSLPLDKINDWVRKDMDRYIDQPVREKIKTIEGDLYFWTCFKTATLEGKLTKEDRDKLTNEFGEKNMKKLIASIQDMSVDEVAEFLNYKIEESKRDLSILFPSSAGQRISDVYDKANLKLKG